jgi:hypothetical protein
MAVKVETPPALAGGNEQQLKQVYAYLYRLSENLNVALNNLNEENFSAAYLQRTDTANDGSEGGKKNLSETYAELRSLIINTAEIIRTEMDMIQTELNKSYTAISSEWGTYQQNIQQSITATAEGIVQQFALDEGIETMQEAVAGFSEYKIHTEGFIKSGFIDRDENQVPILGIAIGQGLNAVKVTIDGNEHWQIDSTQSCAFYTAEKVSFRVNGQEVAYISNSKLYITNVEITGSIVLSGKWKIETTNGFLITWMGG